MSTRKKMMLPEAVLDVRQRFLAGLFPVATTDTIAHWQTNLGLVVSRGYNSEETFFTMLLRAKTKGAQGIAGYRESVAFHPDGSSFYTCYGTAITLNK